MCDISRTDLAISGDGDPAGSSWIRPVWILKSCSSLIFSFFLLGRTRDKKCVTYNSAFNPLCSDFDLTRMPKKFKKNYEKKKVAIMSHSLLLEQQIPR